MFCSMCTSREELQRIADEQAALRRVATLIARSTVPAKLLTAVTQEARAVFNADAVVIARCCPTGTAVVVARAGDDPDKRSVDRGWHTVASPIAVDGRLWGEIAVASRRGHFRADSEERLADFSELVGLAITNAKGQAEALASR